MQIRFEEVTNSTGISYIGTSYGASWGDFNGDTYPDIYALPISSEMPAITVF
jgi:hypothetical protein